MNAQAHSFTPAGAAPRMSTAAASYTAPRAGAAVVPQIDAAIGAHGAWKLRLRTAIRNGESELTPSTVCRDDECAFGKWLYSSEIDPATRAGMPYQVIRRLHAEFHQCAGDVLGQALSGQRALAEAKLEGEFTARSDKLVRALTKWKGELRG